jgi:hypothetical protein
MNTRYTAIQCPRCRVSVPVAALELIARCIDPCCPLNHSRAFLGIAKGCCEGERAEREQDNLLKA